MAKEKYKSNKIVKLDDGSEISSPIIGLSSMFHRYEEKNITLYVDYYTDSKQKAPTITKHYVKKYTEEIDSFSRQDGWEFLLSLDQHKGATKI